MKHCFIFRIASPHTFQFRTTQRTAQKFPDKLHPVSDYRGAGLAITQFGPDGKYVVYVPSGPDKAGQKMPVRIRNRFRCSRQTPGTPASWSQRPTRGRRPSAEPPSRRRRWPGSRRSSKATHACRSGVRRRPSRGPRSRPHLVKPRIPCSSRMAFTRSVSAWLYDKNTAFIVVFPY